MIYNFISKIYKKIINTKINKELLKDLDILANEFNKLFFNTDDIITKSLNKKKL